jgi:hypothetical protein
MEYGNRADGIARQDLGWMKGLLPGNGSRGTRCATGIHERTQTDIL